MLSRSFTLCPCPPWQSLSPQVTALSTSLCFLQGCLMENLSANICRYLSASHLPPSHPTLKVSLESCLQTELRLKQWVMCKPSVSQPGQTHVLPVWLLVLLLAKISEYLCICAQPLLQSTPAVTRNQKLGKKRRAQSPQNFMSAIWIHPVANV